LLDDMLADRHWATPQFAISPAGVLAYAAGGVVTGDSAMVWVSPDAVEVISADMPDLTSLRLSLDGSRILAGSTGAASDIWLYDLTSDSLLRVTSTSSEEWVGAVAPDGKSVIYVVGFGSVRPGIYLKELSGGEPRLLLEKAGRSALGVGDWSRDGRWPAYELLRDETGFDIEMLDLEADPPKEVPFLTGPEDDFSPVFSPTEELLAYQSTQTGQPEIWLRRFPAPDGDIPIQVSRGGGRRPIWSRDGRTLYFVAGRQLVGADVVAEPEIRVERSGPVLDLEDIRIYGVAADGRFLGLRIPKAPPVHHIEVVFNWFDDVRAKMGTGQ
ncbi:MAG: hypothetical protein O6951_05595, partial [Actinobacteria bacterium]|nr:hypothetical protein [Actinomycetota bacterium]